MFFKIASLGDLTDVGKNVAKAGDNAKDVISALNGMSDIDDIVNVLSRSGTKKNTAKEIFDQLDSVTDVTDAMSKFENASKPLESLKAGVKGFLSTTIGKVTAATVAVYGMQKAIQAVSDAYDLSYDSALKNTKESNTGTQTAVSDLDSLISKQDEYKKSLTDIGAKYNVDLSGVDNINDMITKINSQKGISLIDKEEIQKSKQPINHYKHLLLKKKAVSSKEEEAAEHASKSLKRGTASFAQEIERKASKYDSKKYTNLVTPFAYKKSSVTTQVSDDLKMIDKLNNSIEDAKQKQIGATKDSQQWKKSNKEIKEYTKLIDELKTDMSSRQGDLNDLLSAFSVDGKGEEALAGYESEFKEIKLALKDIANMDLTPLERSKDKIDSFFSESGSGKYLKDKIKDMFDKKEGKRSTASTLKN